MKLFVKELTRSASKIGAVQAPRGRQKFFDGTVNEGIPISVLPEEVRVKLDQGQEVHLSELVPAGVVRQR